MNIKRTTPPEAFAAAPLGAYILGDLYTPIHTAWTLYTQGCEILFKIGAMGTCHICCRDTRYLMYNANSPK
jgi:hypothetical protein